MNEKLQKLLKTFEEKSAARDALLAKGEDITAEDIASAKDLNVELNTLKGEIDDLNKIVADANSHKDFLSKPNMPTLVGPNSNAAVKANVSTVPNEIGTKHVRTLGMSPNGNAIVEISDKGVEYDFSGDPIAEKVWKAVAEDNYRAPFRQYLKGGIHSLGPTDLKILQEGIDAEGGYFAPMELQRRLIEKSPAPTRVAGSVTDFPIGSDSIGIPKVVYDDDDIYPNGIRVTLTGEKPSSATVHRVTEPVFGQSTIHVGTWMMSMPLTNDLLEDSFFPLETWVPDKFAQARDLMKDYYILNGTGVGKYPSGILRSPGGNADEPDVVLSAVANSLDAAAIRKLPFELPEQYLNEKTTFVMNRSNCGKFLAGLQATNGEFMLTMGRTWPGLMGRTPDEVAGYPITYSAFMPNIGNGAYPIIFGDLSGYYTASRVGFSVQAIREKYAEENYTLLLGRMRWGGLIGEPFRMRIMKSDDA